MEIRYSKIFFKKVKEYFQDQENMEIFKNKMDIIVNRNLLNFPLMYKKNSFFNHRIFEIEIKSQKFLIAYDFNEDTEVISIINIKHQKQEKF